MSDKKKLKIGQDVFRIERDLSISTNKILAIVTEEKETKYKLDAYSCGGISAKELFTTKNKAEVTKQEFINGLKFVAGTLLIFRYREYGTDEILIGRITELIYGKNPYNIKTSNGNNYEIFDDSIVLKINNTYIENFGKLQDLSVGFDKANREVLRIQKLITTEHDILEKDLKQKFKRQFSWFSRKKKPLFEDRFMYDSDYYDD